MGTAVRLTVRAKPGAREPGIRRDGESVVIAVRERAVGGAANDAILRAVAVWLDVPPSAVVLEHGVTGRHKRLRVSGITPERLAGAIAGLR